MVTRLVLMTLSGRVMSSRNLIAAGTLIFRPHRSTTYVDAAYCYRPSSVVCLSVGLSVTLVSPAEIAEPIDMSFGMWTWVGPRKHVLDKDARCRNRANTIGPSMCGSNAAFLSNFFD